MKYNSVYLEEMTSVPNLCMIIEQIDHAAMLAADEMRRYGVTLPTTLPGVKEKPKRVPLQHEVDSYLRFLVADAFIGFCIAKKDASGQLREDVAAGRNKLGFMPADYDIEGWPEFNDPMFDVVVTGVEGAPPGFLTVRISRRLTG